MGDSKQNTQEVHKLHNIVWFFGCPTSGKTWSADFMEQHHNWIHIDGDEELMLNDWSKHNKFKKDWDTQWDEAWNNKPFTDKTELPFFDNIIRKTEEARKANPDNTVCVAFALISKNWRNYIRRFTNEPVSFVHMQISSEQIVVRSNLRHFQVKYNDSTDSTNTINKDDLPSCWAKNYEKEHGPYEGFQSWSKVPECARRANDWVDFNRKMDKFSAEEQDVFEIDTGEMSASTIPNLEKVLNLPHIQDPEAKRISGCSSRRLAAYGIIQETTNLIEIKKAKLGAKLGEQVYFGGLQPNHEDHKNYQLIANRIDYLSFGIRHQNRYQDFQSESESNISKWQSRMAELDNSESVQKVRLITKPEDLKASYENLLEEPKTQVRKDSKDTHFQFFKAYGGVYQVFQVEKHDGSRYVQHNYMDGTYKAYKAGKSSEVDSGSWSMKNGSYSEKTSFFVDGTLKGDANNFYMDVEKGHHGYRKYIATDDKYILGFKVKELTENFKWDEKIQKRAGQVATVKNVKGDISELNKYADNLILDIIQVEFDDGQQYYVPFESIEEYLKDE